MSLPPAARARNQDHPSTKNRKQRAERQRSRNRPAAWLARGANWVKTGDGRRTRLAWVFNINARRRISKPDGSNPARVGDGCPVPTRTSRNLGTDLRRPDFPVWRAVFAFAVARIRRMVAVQATKFQPLSHRISTRWCAYAHRLSPSLESRNSTCTTRRLRAYRAPLSRMIVCSSSVNGWTKRRLRHATSVSARSNHEGGS